MSNVTSLSEYLKEMGDNGGNGTSRFNLRNENEQVKSRVASIARLKKEKKKKAKLLVVMELAIPFNPTTGKADDIYNADKKFRPQMSATSVALMLKQEASVNEAVKEAFMNRAGVDSWDLSQPEVLTNADKIIFSKYRVPSVYTFPVVNINIPVMTKDFGRDYLIKVTRDPMTNQIVGDKPLAIRANEFFRDIAYEEYSELQDKIASGEVSYTEKQRKELASKIFGSVPVSDDHPVNFIIAMEMPLDNRYGLSETYSKDEFDTAALKKSLVQFKRSKKIDESIKKYVSGEWAKFDKHFDFIEIDMACPTEGETPMEIGKDTEYEKPTTTLDETNYNDLIEGVFREYLDAEADLETIMINSVRIASYDDTVESQLCSSLGTMVDSDNKYITKAVIERHREFITIALGDVGSELLLSVEMDDEDRASGSLDSDKAAEIAKTISLDAALEDDSDELLDLEVIN